MDVNQRFRAVNNRTPRARALGNALREARLDRDIGLRKFAKEIGRDPSLLSRWETGDRTPMPTDVAQILGKLDVSGERYDEIIELAYGTDDARWLATSLPGQRAQLAALLDFEQTASVITDLSPLVVPGLLQTGNYARAIMKDGRVPTDEIGTRVAVRVGRRDVLTRPEPVRLVALVGEAALRQRIGGRDVMVEQMDFLVEMARQPNVDIRIVPFDSDWHPALVGPALLIESETDASVVHIELHDSGLFLHARPDVARYRKAADIVSGQAVNTEESTTLIALARAGWESA